MSLDINVEELLEAAVDVARKGGEHTLGYFGRSIDVDRKEDATPVTVADREAEQVMRAEIGTRFPDHGILGEEYGESNPGARVRWILDPVDGTQSFIHGMPLYTTLVAVEVEGSPLCGVIFAPATGELCEAARGHGCRMNGSACRVRPCATLEEATFLSTDATTARDYDFGKPFGELLDRCRLHRTWGDAYGHMMVAAGRADLMFDPIQNLWDAAPLLPVLEEAGGAFRDVHGEATVRTGNGISCGKELLPQVLKLFR